MIAALLFLVAATQAESPAPHPLDSFMYDVTEACLLPNLEAADPREYFIAHEWSREGQGDKFSKRINGAGYSVVVKWPATKESAAACSFETDDVAAADVYDWFRLRIGEPKDIVWSERQIGGWKMTTNGHDAGVYLSRKRAKGTNYVGMRLHILQN